jgi:hypothetical protein
VFPLLLLLGENRVCGGWVSVLVKEVHHGGVHSVPYTYLFSLTGMVFYECGAVVEYSREVLERLSGVGSYRGRVLGFTFLKIRTQDYHL